MDMSINVSSARAQLVRILHHVQAGSEVTLTRHGEPVAVLIRPDRLRSRRAERAVADAAEIDDLLEAARSRKLRRPEMTDERAGALVADVRSSRSAR